MIKSAFYCYCRCRWFLFWIISIWLNMNTPFSDMFQRTFTSRKKSTVTKISYVMQPRCVTQRRKEKMKATISFCAYKFLEFVWFYFWTWICQNMHCEWRRLRWFRWTPSVNLHNSMNTNIYRYCWMNFFCSNCFCIDSFIFVLLLPITIRYLILNEI